MSVAAHIIVVQTDHKPATNLGLPCMATPTSEPHADTVDDTDRKERGCGDQQRVQVIGGTEDDRCQSCRAGAGQ